MQQTIQDIIRKNSYDGMLTVRSDILAQEIAEALQNKTQTLTCVYCGHEYPPGTPPSNHAALTAHIAICEKHPMRAVMVALGNLVDALGTGEVDMENASIPLRQAWHNARAIVGTNA